MQRAFVLRNRMELKNFSKQTANKVFAAFQRASCKFLKTYNTRCLNMCIFINRHNDFEKEMHRVWIDGAVFSDCVASRLICRNSCRGCLDSRWNPCCFLLFFALFTTIAMLVLNFAKSICSISPNRGGLLCAEPFCSCNSVGISLAFMSSLAVPNRRFRFTAQFRNVIKWFKIERSELRL